MEQMKTVIDEMKLMNMPIWLDLLVPDEVNYIFSGKKPSHEEKELSELASFVRELNTGYVLIGDQQRIKGYSLFLCKQHACELHQLEPRHIYPRRDGDTPVPGPVWQLGKELVEEKYTPANDELEILKNKLNKELDNLL